MEKRLITANLSTQRVTFQPGGAPATFEVMVRNDSDQQAQFQLEVLAPGATRPPGEWYRLSPEVSVAKPPGDETSFQVYIVDTPLPNFIGVLNLTVKVESPQLPGEARRVLALTVEPGATSAQLSLSLTPQRVQAYPRNVVDITVHVRNLSQQPIDTVLHCSGVSTAWMLNGTERRLLLTPRSDEYVAFQCQPPGVNQALCQSYPFQVEASGSGVSTRAEGVLEVLPIGFIKFAVAPERVSIASPKRWRPDFRTTVATLDATYENLSNVRQQVNLEVQGRADDRCRYEVPLSADLGLAETVKLPLSVTADRPWIGWARTVALQVLPVLKLNPPVDVEPPSQTVQIRILPRIPLWLLLALLALLAALLFWLLQPQPIGHTDFVNAVRFSRDALSVVSGADDCTIRRWTIDRNRLQPQGELANAPATSCNGQPLQPQGVLANTGQAVWSLAFFPKDNDRVAAGLENGAVQLWHLPTRQPVQEPLRDPGDATDDRVFALAFTDDSHLLFSGHGSGKIRVWQRPAEGNFAATPTQILSLAPEQNYQVRALAISPDGGVLASAGSRNTLALWNLGALGQPAQLMIPQGRSDEYIWAVAFAPNSRLLATAHSDGEIKLWDLNQCLAGNCVERQHWQAAARNTIAIRSVQFSPDGRQVISASDDGQVILWTLTNAAADKDVLYTSPKKVNSVDLVATDRDLFVVSGGDDHRVRLSRVQPGG